MRGLTIVAAAAALLITSGASAQQTDAVPTCSGELDGTRLTTTIEYADGYAVEAPWRVLTNRPVSSEPGRVIAVHLDRIVERVPESGQKVTTPFPNPIQTTFEGADMDAIVSQAAQVWCVTVMNVREDGGSMVPEKSAPTLPHRITMRHVHSGWSD